MVSSLEKSLVVPPKEYKMKNRFLSVIPATIALGLIISACDKETRNYNEPIQTITKTERIISNQKIQIIVDKSADENSTRSPISIEKVKEIVQQVAELAPIPDTLQVIIVKGAQDRAVPESAQIFVGRDHLTEEAIRYESAHEIGHVLDVKDNQAYFDKYFTKDQIDQLLNLREEALSDPTWGRDYPSADSVLANKDPKASIVPQEGATKDALASGTDIYADGIWISFPDSFSPFTEDLKNALDFIERQPGDESFDNMGDFAQAHQEEIGKLFETSPLMEKAYNTWQEKLKRGLFDSESVLWTAQTPTKAYLSARYTKDWYQVVYKEAQTILFEKFEIGDLNEILSTFSQEKQDFIRSAMLQRKEKADHEKFAELAKVTLINGVNTSLTPYFDLLKSIQEKK